MPTPLALSDSELDVIVAAASPIQPRDRDQFLRKVADLLSTGDVIGPGAVFRACLQAQRQYFRPPDLARKNGSSKYR